MVEQEEFTVENLDGYSDAAGKQIKRSVLKRAPALRKKPIRKKSAVKAGRVRGISKPIIAKKVIKKHVAKPTIKRIASAIRRPAPVKRAPVSIQAPTLAPKKQAPVRAVAPVKRAIPIKKSLNPILGNQKITIPAKGDYVEQKPVTQSATTVSQAVSQAASVKRSTGYGPGLKIITKNDIIIEGDEKYNSAEGKPKNNLTKVLISAAIICGATIFMFKFIK